MNLLQQRRYVEAEAMARKALAVFEKELPDHWCHYHDINLVGGALLGQKKYAEAESYLVRGCEGMKQREAFVHAGFRRWLTEASDRLICFYEATNQPEKARAWRQNLAAARRTDCDP